MIRRSKFILSIAAMLVLSAGLVVGRLSSHLAPLAPTPDHGRGWFIEQLNLLTDQRQKMDAIWANTKQQVDKMSDRRHALDKERDEAIRTLLTAEQLAAYDSIFEIYHAKRTEYDHDRQKLFDDADEQTRKLLTTDQLVKFNSMKKDMHDRGHGGPGGPGGPPGEHQMEGPATQPHGPDEHRD